MHSVYFVILSPHSPEDTASNAIDAATQFLDDNGFAGEIGLYSFGKADWYRTGGRWNGILYVANGTKTEKELDEETEKKWPQDTQYDDAMILTKDMLKYLQSGMYNDTEVVDVDAVEEKMMSDLTEDDIGRWIVVIDYHC